MSQSKDVLISFDNSYARLPERFYARLPPTPVASPRLIRLNEGLARHLRLDPGRLATAEGVEILAGNRVPAGAEPLAMAYAGFQFGGWVPQLGDGRAILLGELIDADGTRRDLQLKGAGRTPFSRAGDGRAGLGPVLREYIVSEAMHCLGVPTTRALAAVTTGEEILRERPLPGAVLARVARSHVRVGTFQYFAARRDVDGLRALSDYVIARHYPAAADRPQHYDALLRAVIDRQAELLARWQCIGFIHGVMNTDNTSIAGETIDYGPCAFMDSYHPGTVYSSIDRSGRYAYGNQPAIAHWNLAGLAQALLPLLGDSEEIAVAWANEAVQAFPSRFEEAYLGGMRRKLGLTETREEDADLVRDLLARMADNGADFTLVYRRLAEALDGEARAAGGSREYFEDPLAFDAWAMRWRSRLASEGRPVAECRSRMGAANPAFIPRNHLVEEAIRAAVDKGDLAPFEELLTVLENPFEDQPGRERFAAPPRADQVVHETFCGT